MHISGGGEGGDVIRPFDRVVLLIRATLSLNYGQTRFELRVKSDLHPFPLFLADSDRREREREQTKFRSRGLRPL